MILFIITGQVPPVLAVALLILCYLTGLELSQEKDMPFLPKAWWVLLVFLLHIFGYGIFRIWLAMRRKRREA